MLTLRILTGVTEASAGSGISMLAPLPFTSVTSDELYLVGRTDALLIEVFINGTKYADGRVVDSVFHVPVRFGYGLNTVRIQPVYSGVEESACSATTIEVLSGPFDAGRLERLYPHYDFHGSELDQGCTPCHDESSLRPYASSDTSACLECHVEFALQPGELVVEGHKDCGVCHTATSDGSLLADATPQRCYSCHPGKIESFSQEYIHGPVAGGSCVSCHEPHRSRFDHSLRSEQEMLCYSCHEFDSAVKNFAVQHPPFQDGRCSMCHDPHSTSNRWVLVKASEEICLECHKPDKGVFANHSHPYNVKPRGRSSRPLQLSHDGRLECLSCHLPHAGPTAHLLRSVERNACIGCHSDMG